MKRLSLAIAVAFSILTVVALIVWCVLVARHALVKEERLHVIADVIDCCAKHVDSTAGEWPRSWSDLEPLDTTVDWGYAKEICRVDFSTDVETVAGSTLENFDAVYPTQPAFRPVGAMYNLIHTCRKYADAGNSYSDPQAGVASPADSPGSSSTNRSGTSAR